MVATILALEMVEVMATHPAEERDVVTSFALGREEDEETDVAVAAATTPREARGDWMVGCRGKEGAEGAPGGAEAGL